MLYTAGKITITTVLTGMFVFLTVFLLDIGKDHWQTVQAQSSGTATTTLTVRNLPPVWVTLAYEQTGTEINNPINSGQTMEWAGRATNNMDYWLIICSNNATPTPTSAANFGSIGDPANAPTCSSGGFAWAVSGPTESGELAVAATTTTEDAPFNESNDWWGWVCDDDDQDPRCNPVSSQGLNATNSSPFIVNFRPTLTAAANSGPTEPGETITFTSTSSDPDTLRGNDDIFLHVCATPGFSNGSCTGDTLAVTTGSVQEDATAEFNIVDPTPRFLYDAYVYLVDEFDHEAVGGAVGNNVGLPVANATPIVSTSTISINEGDDITLTNAGTESAADAYTLSFTASDANTCVALDSNGDSLGAGSEFRDEVIVSLYRSGVGQSSCSVADDYNPNSCYQSEVGTSVWNLSCTKDVSSCDDQGIDTVTKNVTYNCEFPLWYLTDPTLGTPSETPYSAEEWLASVSVIDVEFATSSFTENAAGGVDVAEFMAFDLSANDIAYGSLEPGEDTGNLIATSTIVALGNVGVDQELEGTDMCDPDDLDINASPACPVSASSTIPVAQQQYQNSPSIAYGAGISLSASPTLFELNVFKPTSTSTPTQGSIYWGIEVPSAITFAGSYTGQNSFSGQISNPSNWGL